MTDLTRSLVRTYTPIAVGFLVSLLAHFGIKNPATVSAIGAVAASVYFTLIRLAEKKYPAIGKLLGAAGAPTYPRKLLVPTVAGDTTTPPVKP